MVRRTERPDSDERILLLHLARYAVNLCRLQRLLQTERRQDGRHALGQHRLSTAWRAYHNDIVTAGGGNLQCPLDALLPLHIGKVILIVIQMVGKLCAGIDNGLFQQLLTVQMVNHLLHIVGSIHLQIIDNGSLACICLGHDDALELLSPCLYGYGKGTLYRAQAAVERKLPHDNISAQVICPHVACGGQYADGNGEVVGGTLLLQVCRGHINHHLLARDVVTILADGGGNALLAFLHRTVGQTDKQEVHPYIHAHLHRHHQCLDTAYRTAECLD